MAAHGNSIATQAETPGNDWNWAIAQSSALQKDIAESDSLRRDWSSCVRTSTLSCLLTKQENKETAIAWLEAHKAEIEHATKKIETPLQILVGMHNIMLKKTSEVIIKKEPK